MQATLNVGTETKFSKDAALLQAWQLKVPTAGSDLSARAWWGGAATGSSRSLFLEWNSAAPASEADFFPDGSEEFEVQAADRKNPSRGGQGPPAEGGQEVLRGMAATHFRRADPTIRPDTIGLRS